MINGSSRGSRPILRHQPQLRLDCSPAMCPFSQSDDRDPLLREKERRAGADDPAADDHDIGARRQRVVGADGIDARRHVERVQSIAAWTRLATRSRRAVCHGSGDTKLVM